VAERYRLRVGDYRVLFEIEEKTIILARGLRLAPHEFLVPPDAWTGGLDNPGPRPL